MRVTNRRLLSGFIIFLVVGLTALFVARAQTCPNLLYGDLFKVSDHSAVYLLNAEKKRLYFPHANVYYTWYKDFSAVKTIPNHCVDNYPAPTAPPYGMNYKPGSRLVKLQISPTVYAVLPGNKLFKIESEAAARSLYGPNWASLVSDVPEVYWPNFIGIDNSAPPTFASQNTANINSPLGTNLEAMARWSTTFPIIDSFKMSEGWLINFETDKPLDVDANGWLKSIPKDAQSVDVFIHGHNSEGNFPSGQYVVLYDGEGTITYTGDAEKNDALSKPGRHVINAQAVKGGGIVLKIAENDPKKTGNYIKNIRVIQPGGRCGGDPFSYATKSSDCPQGNFRSFEQDYDKNILHPQFLQNISAFSVVRPMNFLGIMYNPVGKWSERATLSSAFWGDSQGKTSPWELALDIANAIDADAWLNMPYHADDDYVREAARLAKQRLEPKRNVILEYTNEVWNTILPYEKGNAWIQQQAEAAWPRSSEEGFNKRLSWYGKRSVEICRIWKQELGVSRVKCAMGGQAGFDFVNEQMLDCPIWVANGGKRCADEMDSLAVAPYFGSPYDEKGVTTLRKWMKESDGGFKSFFDDIESTSGALQEAKKNMRGNFQVAKQRGLPLIAYEGGQHLLLGYEVNDEAKYTDAHNFLAAVNRHPRMKQAYLKYFQNWKDVGGQLFVHCCAIAASPSIYGYWGLKEVQQEERSKAPKFDATMEFIEKNKKWW